MGVPRDVRHVHHRAIMGRVAAATVVLLVGLGCQSADPADPRIPVAPANQEPPKTASSQPNAPVKLDPAMEKAIADRVEVREDSTIFTLFAMLNAAGYDEEHGQAGMDPVRLEVRNRLRDAVPADLLESIKPLYAASAATATPLTYTVVALTTSGPPRFAPGPIWIDDLSHRSPYRELAWLPGMLRQFQRRVPIDEVYGEVRQAYARAVDTRRASVRREVAAVLAYTRVKNASELSGGGEHARSVFIPNPLLSSDRAYSFTLGDTLYSVEGPRTSPNYDPRELIRAITDPMSYDAANSSAHAEAGALYAEVENLPAIRGKFLSLPAFLDDNLVRAIALRYRAAGHPDREAAVRAEMMRDYNSGFIVERFFYDQLAEFERSSLTLREFYPRMLANLDAQAELDRWRSPDGK